MNLSRAISIFMATALPSLVQARVGQSQRQLKPSPPDTVETARQKLVQQILDQQLNLHNLTIAGDDGDDVFPLGICTGDCDFDDDCEDHLVCHQRSRGQPVPGCAADGEITLESSKDFCIFPPLDFLGTGWGPNDAIPFGRENLPLSMCQGDCDNDNHCGEGLICFQRDRFDPVPGCSGVEEFTAQQNRPTDFCVLEMFSMAYELLGMTPSTTMEEDLPPCDPMMMNATGMVNCTIMLMTNGTMANETSTETSKPLMDDDSIVDVDEDMDEDENEETLTSITKLLTEQDKVAQIIKQQQNSPNLVIAGNDGEGSFPLGFCEGDCDSDEDCEGNLVCLFRNSSVPIPVPGCTDAGSRGITNSTDFCIFPPLDFLGTGWGVNDAIPFDRENLPLSNCQGDCDTDNHCGEGLICFQRGRFDIVPGCSGMEAFTAEYNRPTDFCVLEMFYKAYALLGMDAPVDDLPPCDTMMNATAMVNGTGMVNCTMPTANETLTTSVSKNN